MAPKKASPTNKRGGAQRKTGGKAGGRAGRPSGPVAGTKDKTVRVPASFNAQTVDPTNQRGGNQRPTGGLAGGRAGRPSGNIARPSPSTRGTTPSGGGKNLFGGAGDKNTAVKQAGPRAPQPAFKPSRAPFSRTGPTRASIGNVKPGPAAAAAPRQQAQAQARAMGQAAVRNAQQRRANLAKVQQDLRGQVGKATTMLGGLRGTAYQAIAESVAPRPTSTRANLKEGMAAANAAMKAKNKSADSFGGQYQKPKAGAKPKAAPKMSKAKSFDNAFASARNSGMKTFVWEGKKYNTKMRGEK